MGLMKGGRTPYGSFFLLGLCPKPRWVFKGMGALAAGSFAYVFMPKKLLLGSFLVGAWKSGKSPLGFLTFLQRNLVFGRKETHTLGII